MVVCLSSIEITVVLGTGQDKSSTGAVKSERSSAAYHDVLRYMPSMSADSTLHNGDWYCRSVGESSDIRHLLNVYV